MKSIWALLLLLLLVTGPADALAQSCNGDFQCPGSGQAQTTCLGDAIISKRTLCVGGRCQEVSEQRQSCAAVSAAHCVGANVVERSSGRCAGTLGTCETTVSREVCIKSCSCQKNTLRISTGLCTGSGCGQAIQRCDRGCTCDPTPRCL